MSLALAIKDPVGFDLPGPSSQNFPVDALIDGRNKSETLDLHEKKEKETNETLNAYFYEVTLSKEPLLSADEERHYGNLVKKGDKKAREIMITRNLRLVYKIASRYFYYYQSRSNKLPLMDLVSEGNIGLIRAVEKFNPDKGFRFSTYATWWIRQSIERALMNQSETIRIPVHVKKNINAYRAAERKLTPVLNRKPTVEEIAEATNIPVKRVKSDMALFEEAQTTHSLDAPITHDASQNHIDFLEQNDEQLDKAYEKQEVLQKLFDILNLLNPRERTVISRRYGLFNSHHGTLESIAKELGVTRERVRQIQMSAEEKLYHYIRNAGLTHDDILVYFS